MSASSHINIDLVNNDTNHGILKSGCDAFALPGKRHCDNVEHVHII